MGTCHVRAVAACAAASHRWAHKLGTPLGRRAGGAGRRRAGRHRAGRRRAGRLSPTFLAPAAAPAAAAPAAAPASPRRSPPRDGSKAGGAAGGAASWKASGTEIATVSSAPKTPLAGFGRGFEQTSERAKAANATPAAAGGGRREGEWSSSAARTQVARLKAGGVRYERRALELDDDNIRVGDRRVPLAALRVAVTESKELEFSVDCSNDGGSTSAPPTPTSLSFGIPRSGRSSRRTPTPPTAARGERLN